MLVLLTSFMVNNCPGERCGPWTSRLLMFVAVIFHAGLFENQRAHPSPAAALDICDYCTNTDTKLYTLYEGNSLESVGQTAC